jgi:predicted dienelactone hydrolase
MAGASQRAPRLNASIVKRAGRSGTNRPATSVANEDLLKTGKTDAKQKNKSMKQIQTAFQFLTALALAALAASCASNLEDKENVAVAAGFKVITPTKPDQQALLRKLPADKVTKINHGGKTYYVLPDLKNNQAYVGGPKQYQAYQRLRQQQLKNSEELEEAAEAVPGEPLDRMNWDEWGGWSAVDGIDGPGT